MTPFYEVMHTFAVIFIGTSAFLACFIVTGKQIGRAHV